MSDDLKVGRIRWWKDDASDMNRWQSEVDEIDREECEAFVAACAERADMRPHEFLRKLRWGNRTAKAAYEAEANVREIDIERLQEILEMILEFIKALLTIFAMV